VVYITLALNPVIRLVIVKDFFPDVTSLRDTPPQPQPVSMVVDLLSQIAASLSPRNKSPALKIPLFQEAWDRRENISIRHT
jgi:hypothetical protein